MRERCFAPPTDKGTVQQFWKDLFFLEPKLEISEMWDYR